MRTFIIIITLLFSIMAQSKEQTIKQIMQQLERSMQKLHHGIFYEDYATIKQAAKEIAEHPKPTGELTKIVTTLGFKMFQFKKFDSKVHDPASEIIHLTNKKDLTTIMQKQQQIMQNCMACHLQFRQEIRKALQAK